MALMPLCGMQTVLHVIDHSEEGGAQVVLGDIAKALSAQFEFSVAVLGRSGRFSPVYEELGMQVQELGKGVTKWDPKVAFRLWRTIRSLRPKIVHTHLFKSNVLGVLVARAAGCPAIIHDHSGMTPAPLTHYFSMVVKCLYLLAFRTALRCCSKVIVLTPAEATAYRQSYGDLCDKVVVVPNGVDVTALEEASKGESSIRTELGLPEDARLVVSAGRLLDQKDWRTFVDVARRVGGHGSTRRAFLIAGTGPVEAPIRRKLTEDGVTNVYLLGYRDDVPRLLAQSDVCLLTSRRESFGLILLEAMALGCPVVATRCGGPEAIVNDGNDGLLVPVGDAVGLADAVQSLLSNPGLSQRLVSRARAKVRAKFTLAKLGQNVLGVYRVCMGL